MGEECSEDCYAEKIWSRRATESVYVPQGQRHGFGLQSVHAWTVHPPFVSTPYSHPSSRTSESGGESTSEIGRQVRLHVHSRPPGHQPARQALRRTEYSMNDLQRKIHMRHPLMDRTGTDDIDVIAHKIPNIRLRQPTRDLD